MVLTAFRVCCAVFVLQGEGLQLLLNEGAEKNSWPKSFAATHKFKSDPVIPLPDVTMVDFDRDMDEFLVVATDGLWDCMPPAEAIRYARWVERLGGVSLALVPGGCVWSRRLPY
jgi:serine/threonine protein phosphatase PrpC